MTWIRPASSGDAQDIAELMRASMPPHELEMSIFGCHGVVHFLHEQLSLPSPPRTTQCLVAGEGDAVAGYLELKYAEGRVFLNHICTAATARGCGIGSGLLHEGVLLALHAGQKEMYLDVSRNNWRARSWYRRLAFQPAGGKIWWQLPLMPAATGRRGRIVGYGRALALAHRYGFSSFDLRTRRAAYTIGRLGAKWFRTADSGLVDDVEALASLADLDGGRSILGLFPLDVACEGTPGARKMRTAYRMVARLAALRDALADRSLLT